MPRPTRLTPGRRALVTTVIADTGALYALIDRSDAWHERVRTWWERNRHPVIVPSSVLPEICYLLQTRIGAHAELAFMRAVASSEFAIESLDASDLARIPDVMHAYADLPLGFVDASVVAIGERLEVRDVLTTDRRHFGAVRPRHVQGFQLLP